jgi:hypothetical protein
MIDDLAAAGIDRGHLANVVRDVMIKYDLPTNAVAGILARYARRYGGATGNGSGLLTVLLREAGVPRSTMDCDSNAIAHGADHIHIVATLVRQDRRTYWARNDYPLAQARLSGHRRSIRPGTGVGPPGRGSRSWPKAGELNKTARRRRLVTPRDELRRRVRDAATVAVDEDDFFTRLTHDRVVTVRLRESERNPGQITGYAVHLAIVSAWTASMTDCIARRISSDGSAATPVRRC